MGHAPSRSLAKLSSPARAHARRGDHMSVIGIPSGIILSFGDKAVLAVSSVVAPVRLGPYTSLLASTYTAPFEIPLTLAPYGAEAVLVHMSCRASPLGSWRPTSVASRTAQRRGETVRGTPARSSAAPRPHTSPGGGRAVQSVLGPGRRTPRARPLGWAWVRGAAWAVPVGGRHAPRPAPRRRRLQAHSAPSRVPKRSESPKRGRLHPARWAFRPSRAFRGRDAAATRSRRPFHHRP